MSRNQLRYVFGALTITAMALMLVLAFGHNASRVTESAASSDVAALQAENTQLNQTLQVMQQREQQYQAAIQQANQTIAQLSDELSAAQLGSPVVSDGGQFAAPLPAEDDFSILQQLFGNSGFASDDSVPSDDDSGSADQFTRPLGHSHEGRRP